MVIQRNCGFHKNKPWTLRRVRYTVMPKCLSLGFYEAHHINPRDFHKWNQKAVKNRTDQHVIEKK